MGNDAGNKLEAPKLGFKRKKRADAAESEAPEPAETAAEKESGPRLLSSVVRRVAKPTEEPAEDTAPEPARAPKPSKEPKAAREPKPAKPITEAQPAKEPKVSAPRDVPISDGPLAAGLVGLVVGVFLVAAVWVCEQVSQQTRGTTALGRAGLPLLVAIFVLAVVGGTLLLRLAKTPSPGSVSFLATALVAVLAVLFLGDNDDTLWAGIVVVVLSIAAFLLARWVTVRYIDAE